MLKIDHLDQSEHERWWRQQGARELRALLFFEWDPIGLSELADAPLDEYEHYAGQIVRRLRAGASSEDLAAVLATFNADMGLEPAADRPTEVAKKIRSWYGRSTSDWKVRNSVST
ncbi:MAG: hypothetical protein NVSMB25_09500 [Thermoleophilaceae bacterium]